MLKAIKIKWDIDFNILSNFDEKEVYRSVFLKNRTMLKKRTGKGVNDLRSNKGHVYVNGVIATYDDSEEILYYVKPWESEQFLNNLLSKGLSHVQEIVNGNLLNAAKGLPEDQLIVEFLNNPLQFGYCGEIKREFPLVRQITPDSSLSNDMQDFVKSFSYISAKYIDMLHIAKDGFYDIIEAKIKLNWEALGQVIGYRKIFCDLNSVPIIKTRTAILCRESDGFIEYICDSLNVRVIIISKSENQ